MSTYNKYYQKENYFGQPYPELIAYAQTLDSSLSILDIGCGQGRDALALGRLGFKVTGLDVSEVGIHQMHEVASLEDLNVKGIVMDYEAFKDYHLFDVLLLDSMFHFYKKDLAHETNMLNMFIDHMKMDSIIMIFVQKSRYRVNTLKEIIAHSKHNMLIIHEQSLIYQAFNSEFYMLVVKKVHP